MVFSENGHPRTMCLGRLVFFVCVFFGPLSLAVAGQEEDGRIEEGVGALRYPEVGIFSTDRLDHLYMWDALGSDWYHTFGRDQQTCKLVNDDFSIEKLSRLMVFEESDITPITDETRPVYGRESQQYFKTCNYLDFPTPRIFTWGLDKNSYLEWHETDAFIDAEHSLLLLDFLNEDRTRARVLVINKKHQFYANKAAERRKKSWLSWDWFY